MQAALADTELPTMSVVEAAEGDNDPELEMDEDKVSLAAAIF